MIAGEPIDERLRQLSGAFPARPELADAVMASIAGASPTDVNRTRRWIMRSTFALCVAVCGVVAVLLIRPPQSARAYELPIEAQMRWVPLGVLKDYDVAFKPALKPYRVQPDLSNVQPSEALKDMTDNRRKLLAANGILILPSVSKEFYEIYLENPAPFVTSDCVLHAYHVLLAETLRNAELHCLSPRQALLASAGFERMKVIRAEVGEALAPAARDALVYWAVAARLADPNAAVPAEVQQAVAAELERIGQAAFIGAVDGQGPKRDYTIYQPIAGYGASDELRRYFVLNRYFTLATQPMDSDRGAQACMLSALAVGTGDKALAAWLEIARYRELLGGLGEDPTPITLLAAARKTFGDKLTHATLAEAQSIARLRKTVAAQPRGGVADQPQSVPGADPLAGYGMRMFPPGVTVRAMAYQDVAAARERTPRGEHVAALLGNELPAVAEDLGLLKKAMDELSRRGKDAARQDVHTLAMLAMSRLPFEGKEGYPSFMAQPAWRIKTANTQMGAWSQVEHDLCLYVKDNALYASAPMPMPEDFHGYVEPAPGFYAALASLTGRTREAFGQLGVFKITAREASSRPKGADKYWRPAVAVTENHFKALESLLLRLRDMSVKELEDRTFDQADIKLLKGLGRQLKHLAMNDSTSDEAREPMSTIVRIAREYLEEKGRYVGVGRPLKIIAVVPYGGKLHCAVGAVYSYYEFDRPLRDALTDKQWKGITAGALEVQPYQPWLMGNRLGLDAEECSAEQFRAWLPARKASFNSSSHALCARLLQDEGTMYLLNKLGSTRLTPEAVDLACAAWVEAPLEEHGMAALYVLLKDAPAQKRAEMTAAAMPAIEKTLAGNEGRTMGTCDGRAWLYFTLRLMEGTKPDAQTLRHIRNFRDRADTWVRANQYLVPMTEIRDAADAVLSAGSSSQPAGGPATQAAPNGASTKPAVIISGRTEKPEYEVGQRTSHGLTITNRSSKPVTLPSFRFLNAKQEDAEIAFYVQQHVLEIQVTRGKDPVAVNKDLQAPAKEVQPFATVELPPGQSISAGFSLTRNWYPSFFSLTEPGEYNMTVTLDTTKLADEKILKGRFSSAPVAFRIVPVAAFREKRAGESQGDYAKAKVVFYLDRIAQHKGEYFPNVGSILRTPEAVPALIETLDSKDAARASQAGVLLGQVHHGRGTPHPPTLPESKEAWRKWWETEGAKLPVPTLWSNFDSYYQ